METVLFLSVIVCQSLLKMKYNKTNENAPHIPQAMVWNDGRWSDYKNHRFLHGTVFAGDSFPYHR